MIKVENLAKQYRGGKNIFWALTDINLEIKTGEFIAILGPSGSGKSTLMHLIGGLDKPTKGEVWVDEQNLAKLPGSKLAKFRNQSVGFVFQFFNLISRTNVFDNVKLPLIYSSHSMAEAKEKVLKVLSNVGLSGKLKNRPNELSGGEQQRVAIARALVNDPTIILADEPTGNLDSKTGQEIMNILLGLKKAGKTILMVTHERDLAEKADRIVTMKDGKLIR